MLQREIENLKREIIERKEALVRAEEYKTAIERLDLTQSEIDCMESYYFYTDLTPYEAFVMMREAEKEHSSLMY